MLRDRLWKAESAEYLAVARIACGLVMLYEFYKMWQGRLPGDPRTITHNFGQLQHRFFAAPYHSVYYYVSDWLPRLQTPEWMRFFTGLWAVCGAAVVLGLYYHLAIATFTALFAYHYLLGQEHYLNHQYLFLVICAVMALLPANGIWSLDALLHRWKTGQSLLPTGRVPRWMRLVLVLLLDITYIYGGYQKVNVDWLRAEPLFAWLPCRKIPDAVCTLLHGNWWYPYVMSYGGLVYDIAIPFILHSSRWLPLGLLLSLIFHLHNYLQFNIGVFPWMCLAFTTLYLPPDWPSRWWELVPRWPYEDTVPDRHVSFEDTEKSARVSGMRYCWWWRAVFTLCLAMAVVQVTVPLRSSLYPTDPAWTDEGHMFSWRMKLRDRQTQGTFILHDLCSDTKTVYDPMNCTLWNQQYDERGRITRPGTPLLSTRAWKKVRTRPDMLQVFSRSLGAFFERHFERLDKLATQGRGAREGCHVAVYGDFIMSLNRRPWAHIVDPDLDLADPELSNWVSDWMLPEPDMPGFYRHQYPWVFWPALVGLAKDNPCTPWHYDMADDSVRSYPDATCLRWWYKNGGREEWFSMHWLHPLRIWDTWIHRKFEDVQNADRPHQDDQVWVPAEEGDEEVR